MKFETKDYWNGRYASGVNSGYGSSGEQLIRKLGWLSNLPVNSVLDLGCGDFNVGRHLMELNYPKATYLGYDSSSVIVIQNQTRYPDFQFTSEFPTEGADLTLCIDVLFHILEDEGYQEMLTAMQSYKKYLAVTAYEYDQPYKDKSHVIHRKFDYKAFGTPIIREIIEPDGELYFYLFKREFVDITKTTCILITKDKEYPQEVLKNIDKYPFGQVIIGLNSGSPYSKYELIKKAKFDTIYYQDDDAIVPIQELLDKSQPGTINVGMKPGHIEAYKDKRMTMGLGWGTFFPKELLGTLKTYTDVYGEDEVFQRETERILTYLNFPQNRIPLDIVDTPAAWAPDRLWRQPIHGEFKDLVEKRCSKLVKK